MVINSSNCVCELCFLRFAIFLIKKKKVTLAGTLLQGIVIDMNDRGFTGGKNGVYSYFLKCLDFSIRLHFL